MSLYFVTGVSATGKSTVTHELRGRGYIAYDTDDDALARWQHNESGFIHPKSSVKAEQRTEEFLTTHSWNVPREYIEKIAVEAADTDAFVCGAANNIAQLRDLFSGVFALVIDEPTLRDRLAHRTNNDWGKQAHELQQTLDTFHASLDTYRALGYVMIDAAQPTPLVVDAILAQIST